MKNPKSHVLKAPKKKISTENIHLSITKPAFRPKLEVYSVLNSVVRKMIAKNHTMRLMICFEE